MAMSAAERQRKCRERKRSQQAAAVTVTPSQPVTPATITLRPREMRVIANKAMGMSTRQAMIEAGFGPSNGTMAKRLQPGGDLAIALGKLLDEQQASLPRVVRHASNLAFGAKRLFNAARGRDKEGKTVTECIEAEDNDAQLRASEILIGLHERAGTIPAAAAPVPGHQAASVRMIQIDPDGTERVLEIG